MFWRMFELSFGDKSLLIRFTLGNRKPISQNINITAECAEVSILFLWIPADLLLKKSFVFLKIIKIFPVNAKI